MNANSPRERSGQSIDQTSSPWRELGIPEPIAAASGKAPEVDRALLRRLVRQELSDEAARMVYSLIEVYPEWNTAHAKLLVEEFHNR